MNRKQLFLTTGAALGLTTLVLAHHVPVALSHVFGTEILSEVIFFTGPGLFGVPAHKVGAAEAPDSGPVGLTDGDAFTIADETGTSETITLTSADFLDIASADLHETLHVINDKASLFEAYEENGFVVLRGLRGGAAKSLDVTDGVGGPLSKMGLGGGLVFGSDDLELTLSIPDPNLNLAGRTYLLFASATPGSFTINNKTIPIGLDALTSRFLNFALSGAPNGFLGTLDGNSDATVFLTAANLQAGFAGGYPDKLYFAYIVLGPGNQRVAYVSNAFTVDFQ